MRKEWEGDEEWKVGAKMGGKGTKRRLWGGGGRNGGGTMRLWKWGRGGGREGGGYMREKGYKRREKIRESRTRRGKVVGREVKL